MHVYTTMSTTLNVTLADLDNKFLCVQSWLLRAHLQLFQGQQRPLPEQRDQQDHRQKLDQ